MEGLFKRGSSGNNGGGASVGNEGAIDLLKTINESKKVLAGNLEGLGITASASGNTLEELATKVADVVVDNDRQKVPALLLCNNISKSQNVLTKVLGDTGWIFSLYNNKVYFFRLSSFFDSDLFPKNNNTSYNLLDVENFYIDITPAGYIKSTSVTFNKSYSKCFICTNTTLYIYEINYVNKTATLIKSINHTGFSDNILNLSVNDSETYVMATKRQWNTTHYLYFLDLTTADEDTHSWQSVYAFNTQASKIGIIAQLINDDDIIVIDQTQNNETLFIMHYRINYDTMTLSELQFSRNVTTGYFESFYDTNMFAQCRVNNKDYVFINGSPNLGGAITLMLYNVTDKILTEISTNYSNGVNDNHVRNPSVNIQLINNQYVVTSGLSMCPVILDSSLNILSKNLVNKEASSVAGGNILYNSDLTVMLSIGDNNFYKRTIYNNKRCLYARTLTKVVDEQETTKTMYYPVSCTEQDVIDGFLDEE